MRTRTFWLAGLALAAALTASGCGNKCNDQTPPVNQVPIPASCTAVAGSPVTVPIHVCPRCDQGMPACDAHPLNGTQIVLEPVSEVCDANSSCPIVDPVSCPASTTNCNFTAPSNPDTYQLVIVTPEGQITKTLTVVAAGPASCSF